MSRLFIVSFKVNGRYHCFTMTKEEIKILGTGKGIDRISFVYGVVTSMMDDELVPDSTYFWFQKESTFDPNIETQCIGMNLTAFYDSMNKVNDEYLLESCDKIRESLMI
jgi:hypothetical protein